MQPGDAFQLIMRIVGAGIAIDALEHLALRAEFAEAGSLAWSLVRQKLVGWPPALRRVADALFAGPRRFLVAQALRLAAAVVSVVGAPIGGALSALALTVLVVSQLALHVRRAGLGLEGADQLFLLVPGATWIATVLGDGPVCVRLGVDFIAVLAALAYAVSGLKKLGSSSWRTGTALRDVIGTGSFGSARLSLLLEAHPSMSTALCWSVIAFECAFPIVLVLPPVPRLALLALGTAFHVSNALVMGLNLFPWAFTATYPALWLAGG
jgi:hypothetical protein